MTQINPFTGAIIQGTQVQQRQGIEKERHIRRVQNLSKNAALQGDRLEHQVESSDALGSINDQGTKYNPQRRPPQRHAPGKTQHDEGQEHIDVKA
jgi:hypothetical protein